MRRHLRNCCAASVLWVLSFGAAAWAQKPGGILKLYSWDSPPSVSILDGPNPIGQRTMAGVFNNLVMFDQHVKQNSLGSIVADLATGWSWGEDGKELTFKLRSGVKWHDGKPFIAKDVVCTWICCSKSRATGCAATRSNTGTPISSRSPPTATSR